MGMREITLVAIDGPGGVGKSSVAKALAGRLNYFFLSSGLIYRAMAWYLKNQGWRPPASPDPAAFENFHLGVTAEGGIELGGSPLEADLHEEAISAAASLISTLPAIRSIADSAQRETVSRIGAEGSFTGVILEGRDIGTVVFPDAAHKIFLSANEKVRAERRFLEERSKGASCTLESVRKALLERDGRDSSREVAPLKPAEDALVIDTSNLTLQQVVEKIMKAIDGGSR